MTEELIPGDPGASALFHRLGIRGRVPSGHPAAEVLVAMGYASERSGWLVRTAEGLCAHRETARLTDGSTEHQATERAFEGFLPLNARLLAACTAWQIRDGAPNDHTDPVYDWEVVDRVGVIDDRAAPLLRGLGTVVLRFGGYPGRLRGARQRLEEGDHAWLASPRCDSYHTVWMELHEDFLVALGRDREEGVGGPAA